MLELFKSEFLRYRKWGFLAAGAFLAAFIFVARIKPFLAPEQAQYAITNMVMIGGSIAFGLIQFLLHKRQNHWTYLVHRPIETHKIYIALMGAGIATLAIAVGGPWLVMVGGIDLATATVVDARHYAFIFNFILLCAIGYLVGSLAALNPSKGSVLLAIVLVVLMVPEPASNLAQFLPKLIVLAGLVALNLHSFKPDLALHVKKPWAILTMGGTMSFALVFGLIMFTTVIYHIPKFLMGTHPDNNPIDGTLRYYFNHEYNKRPTYALTGSEHPRAAQLAKSAELADVEYISVDRWSPPRRGQMYNQDRLFAFEHGDTNTIWQFSHDSMLLEGRHSISNEPVGAVGQNGFIEDTETATEADRFIEVPTMVGSNLMATPSKLYQVNFEDRLLEVKLEPAEGEVFISRPQIREHYVAISTDKNILMFDKREFVDEYEKAEPEFVVPHPVDTRDVYFVETFRMVDGYLLIYIGPEAFGFDKPGTAVVHAKLGGDSELIYDRHYQLYAHPAWIRHFEYMVSPALFVLKNALFYEIEPEDTDHLQVSTIMSHNYPSQVYWIAIALHLCALGGAILLARRNRLEKDSMATWCILSVVAGLPALIAFALMTPWRKEQQEA